MVITVGEIDISTKLKEALTNTGVSHQSDERSLSDGGASFTVTIPSFVANFKRNLTPTLIPDTGEKMP